MVRSDDPAGGKQVVVAVEGPSTFYSNGFLFISDLDKGVESTMFKFADST